MIDPIIVIVLGVFFGFIAFWMILPLPKPSRQEAARQRLALDVERRRAIEGAKIYPRRGPNGRFISTKGL